jgi:predicted RNA-binding Zn-ribbon protein involved in translation (DUF1610 family)
MNEAAVHKGPWTHRFLIVLFTVILGLLTYWLLGFVVNDIGTWPGPSYEELEKQWLDKGLRERQEKLESSIAEIARKIDDQKQRQSLLNDSTANSQRTMNQLIEIRRLGLEKGVAPSAEEQKALAESQRLFLANQDQYQRLNEDLAKLNEELRSREQEKRDLDRELEEARKPIREEYQSQMRRHNLLMAALKLSFLTPLLVVAAVLFVKCRRSVYVWLVYALGIAVAVKVMVVMHEYFPSRYFKYVLILTSLAIAGQILVYLLRMVAFPKRQWLLKQYREAYEAFLCPVCGHPIRRGPLKYLSWTRRSIRKQVRASESGPQAEEAYTCPSCATRLYEECGSCHAIRPSLLPACDKCGSVKPELVPEEK